MFPGGHFDGYAGEGFALIPIDTIPGILGKRKLSNQMLFQKFCVD
jgi:hypothetical protein